MDELTTTTDHDHRATGLYRSASGWTVTCKCGWKGSSARSASEGGRWHETHRAEARG